MSKPKRGEIWLVQLDPARGLEIKKTRPAIIINANFLNANKMRIIIPITKWQDKFNTRPFMVSIPKTIDNGLNADSAGNILQVRSVTTERFIKCLGKVSEEILQELLIGLIVCVDYATDES